VAFGVLVALATAATAVLVPEAFARVTASAFGWLFVVVVIASAVLAWVFSAKGADLQAFYASSLGAVGLVGIWAAAIFPALVPSTGVGDSLTIVNSSSSALTLTVMLIIAAIGVPLVLFYFFLIYRTYAGRIDASMLGQGGHY